MTVTLAGQRGLIEDEEEDSWQDAKRAKLPQMALNILAYNHGYASLLASDPYTMTQPAATAMDCFEQCSIMSGCLAWTTQSGMLRPVIM